MQEKNRLFELLVRALTFITYLFFLMFVLGQFGGWGVLAFAWKETPGLFTEEQSMLDVYRTVLSSDYYHAFLFSAALGFLIGAAVLLNFMCRSLLWRPLIAAAGFLGLALVWNSVLVAIMKMDLAEQGAWIIIYFFVLVISMLLLGIAVARYAHRTPEVSSLPAAERKLRFWVFLGIVAVAPIVGATGITVFPWWPLSAPGIVGMIMGIGAVAFSAAVIDIHRMPFLFGFRGRGPRLLAIIPPGIPIFAPPLPDPDDEDE